MQIREAHWLGEQLAAVSDGELFPVLDVGSSTEHFRTVMQPYIDERIFAPLRRRGGTVWHLDVKEAPGVDVVGDLTDPEFQARLRAMRPRTVLLNSVLHHIPNRREIERIVLDILPPGGRVFVSGPHRFPRHFDPVDTMFRPTVEEIAAEFPGTTLEAGAILSAGNWRTWRKEERGQRSLPRTLVRLLLPFYRPAEWRKLAVQAPYILKEISSFAAVLRKADEAEERAA